MRDFLRRLLARRTARAATLFLVALHLGAVLAAFLAPYSDNEGDAAMRYVPPQRVHVRDGGHVALPFVRRLNESRDPETGEISWSEDSSTHVPIRLLPRGSRWNFLGLLPCERHLFGSSAPLHLLGTDTRGRDLLSRILIGSQISLSLALFAVFLHATVASLLGALSGWYGGVFDLVMQRVIELIASFPSIPLFMALAAAIPNSWSPALILVSITIILSLLSWGSLARQVRGRILTEREADYVTASRAAGAGPWHIVRRHLLPSVSGHVAVASAASVPGFILSETSLSFLGLGVRKPMVSWGLLLQDAGHVRTILNYWWLLFPAVPAIFTVIAWNLLADALRDAFDPRHRG